MCSDFSLFWIVNTGKDRIMYNESDSLKKLKVTMMIKVLLIFGGIIFMQLISYMICVLGYVVFGMICGKGYARALAEVTILGQSSETNIMLAISAISAALSFIWCTVLYVRSSWREEHVDYKNIFSVKNISTVFCIGSGCCILLTFLLSILTSLFPDMFKNYTELMSNFENGNLALTLLYAVFIGPVSEEMIFRGAIFDRVYTAFPFWKANVIQAALFGIYHMNIIQGLYAFCLGIVLGLIVKTTGSILCSMLTHIIFNGTSYLLPVLLGTGLFWVNVIAVIVMLFLVAAGIYGIKFLMRSLR